MSAFMAPHERLCVRKLCVFFCPATDQFEKNGQMLAGKFMWQDHRIDMSSTCYTKQNNKERHWMAWTQNGRVIRWGSFCEQLRHGSTFIIKSDHMRGSITSLRFTMRSRMSWRIFLHSPSGDVYFSRDWTILKLWEEHRIFYEDLPGGWYLRAVSQPLRRASAQGTRWARGRRNAGPFTRPPDPLDYAWHHPRGL